MKRIASYATLLVVLAAGLLVGCGGGGNNRARARGAPPAAAAGRGSPRRRGRAGRAPARGGEPARTRDALAATGRRGGGDPRRSQGARADVPHCQRQPPAAGAAQRAYRAGRSLAGSQPHAEHAGGGDARRGELGLGAGSAWRHSWQLLNRLMLSISARWFTDVWVPKTRSPH